MTGMRSLSVTIQHQKDLTQRSLSKINSDVQRAAIICCIESGTLEAQVVRLANSIRKYGGSLLSTVPIIAVRPRLGPPLSRPTRQSLRQFQVELIERRMNRSFAWQHYTNKAHALLAAEDVVSAEQYIWLDSDVLFLADPSEHLILRSPEDFAACAPDRGSIGSSGPEDRNDEIWHRACDTYGIDINSLPWVVTCTERLRIRFYLNSGVFVYRRSSGFAQTFAEDCFRHLRAKASRSHVEVHFSDQLVLSLCVHRMGLKWRLLPHSCNYACYSKLLECVTPGDLASAQILHYHDMMTAKNWPQLVSLIRHAYLPCRGYLESMGPLRDPSGRMARGARELLRIVRGLKRRSYYLTCGFQK